MFSLFCGRCEKQTHHLSITFNHYTFVLYSFSCFCTKFAAFPFFPIFASIYIYSKTYVCVCLFECMCQFNLVVAHEHIACGSVSIIMVNKWFLMMSDGSARSSPYHRERNNNEEKSCENLFIYKHYRCRYFISYHPSIVQCIFLGWLLTVALYYDEHIFFLTLFCRSFKLKLL